MDRAGLERRATFALFAPFIFAIPNDARIKLAANADLCRQPCLWRLRLLCRLRRRHHCRADSEYRCLWRRVTTRRSCNVVTNKVCMCAQVSYCSDACERLDWPQHRDACRASCQRNVVHRACDMPDCQETANFKCVCASSATTAVPCVRSATGRRTNARALASISINVTLRDFRSFVPTDLYVRSRQ